MPDMQYPAPGHPVRIVGADGAALDSGGALITTTSAGDPALLSGTRAYDYANGHDVAVGVASAASASAITATEVALSSTVPCRILVGVTPTAVATTGLRLPAETLVHIQIDTGDKVAVIRDAAATADGVLTVTPVA